MGEESGTYYRKLKVRETFHGNLAHSGGEPEKSLGLYLLMFYL